MARVLSRSRTVNPIAYTLEYNQCHVLLLILRCSYLKRLIYHNAFGAEPTWHSSHSGHNIRLHSYGSEIWYAARHTLSTAIVQAAYLDEHN